MVAVASIASPRFDKLLDLASGGMGSVELVARREGTFVRLYARKRLHPHLATDDEFVAMFLDEARIAALIRHPNVVAVLDLGRDAEGPYLLMEFVSGASLSTLMNRVARSERWFPLQVGVRIALDIARALDGAHEVVEPTGRVARIIHRDLSPQNVLVGFDGHIALTDFGIAKVLGTSSKTATGVLKGKMGYLAPEQIEFRALGVVLYEMLAGQRLYKAATDDPVSALRRVLDEPPPDIGDVRPDVTPAISELLFELLAKRPEERPDSARDVVDRLEGILADLVRDSPASDLRAFVGEHTRDLRERQQSEVQAAMDRLDRASIPVPTVGATPRALAATAVPRPHEASPRSSWRGGLLVGVGALAVGLLVGAAAMGAQGIAGAPEEALAVGSSGETGPLEAVAGPRDPETTEHPASVSADAGTPVVRASADTVGDAPLTAGPAAERDVPADRGEPARGAPGDRSRPRERGSRGRERPQPLVGWDG
jgi:hypothetical protein